MPTTSVKWDKRKNADTYPVSRPKSDERQGSGFIDHRPKPIDQNKKRSREEMKADVEAAKEYTLTVIDKSETTGEVEQEFPFIKENWGLKEIGWENLGTPQAKLKIEINPAATINRNAIGHLTLGGGTAFLGDIDSNVTFQTAKIRGSDVGVKMEANPIAPNHPQGGPPKGSSLRNVMSILPTTPKLPGDQKYIKGHLLNDNLGGPGEDENLFPITGQANKQHEADVEAYVKYWVNDKGYAAKYIVEVKNVNDQLHLGKPYIDADFHCQAYAMDAGGGISTHALERTIHSRYRQSVATTKVPRVGAAPPWVESNWNVKKSQVELSTAHGTGTQPAVINNAVRIAMNDLIDAVQATGLDNRYIPAILDELFPGISDKQKKILADINYDINHQDFAVYPNPNGQWNTSMNPINKYAGAITDAIVELTARITGNIDNNTSLAAMQRAFVRSEIIKLVDKNDQYAFGDISVPI